MPPLNPIFIFILLKFFYCCLLYEMSNFERINNLLAISSPDLTKCLNCAFNVRNIKATIEERKQREKWAKLHWAHIGRLGGAVCFDVDSTLTKDEMIDQLAAFLHKDTGPITHQAMNGQLSFSEALSLRLAILKPSQTDFAHFVHQYEPRFSAKAVALVAELQRLGVPIFLVSGGFWQVVHKIGARLRIPAGRIFANKLLFDKASGQYRGFDRSQLTSRSGPAPLGKAGVCALLKKRFGLKPLFMIGDGSTDLEARPPANFFIGFGGNQVRERVRLGADLFLLDFGTLLDTLHSGTIDKNKQGEEEGKNSIATSTPFKQINRMQRRRRRADSA